MANYNGFCRSNYFQVKDLAAFEDFCERWNVRMTRGGKNDELCGFIEAESIPLCCYDAEKGEYVDGDFLDELSKHLAPGWVAIVREVGYEAMRYLVGFTVAVNSSGKMIDLNLDSIYDRAKRLGRKITHCEY